MRPFCGRFIFFEGNENEREGSGMTIAAISSNFYTGEYSVFDAGDIFNFPNKSIVGTKSFCITNQGRVFAHDTGGLFGEIQLKTYSNIIIVTLEKNTISLSSIAGESFTFRTELSSHSFIQIYEKVPSNKFLFIFSEKTNCIYQYSDENNINHTLIDELILENDKLKFRQGNIEIPFYRVRNIERKGLFIEITGVFHVGDMILRSLKLFLFDEGIINRLIEKFTTHPTIFQMIGDVSDIYTTTLEANISGQQHRNQKIALCFDSAHIYLINEMKAQLIFKLDRATTKIHFSKLDQKLAFGKDQSIYILEVSQDKLEEYITNYLSKNSSFFRYHIGHLNGTLLGEKWLKEEVSLISEGTTLTLVTSQGLKLLPFNLNDYGLLLDRNNLIIHHEQEIALLQLNEEKLIELKQTGKENNRIIGYTPNYEPYLISQDEERILFKQHPDKSFHFHNEDIINISISKYGEEDSIFSEITIKIKNDPQDLIVYVPNNMIKDFIHKTYYYSKQKALEVVTAEQLFLSYSRQVNDYILYQYFGQIFAMHRGLQEILESDINPDIKNGKIINYLFYSIQALKKHFDTISIYLPSVLEREMQGIIGNQDPSASLPYKNLQRGLMGITGQINRSLNEIEGSVSAVSFVLIPREDYSQLIKDKTNRDIAFSTTLVGLGAASILVAPVAVPALLLGGIFSAVNTFFRQEDSKKQEELRKRNEDNRLDFFVGKALDSMEHLIQTLLPFYISETNHSIYQTFNQVSQEKRQFLQSREVKENLFQKISQYYTYKQLPIDDSVLVRKGELVELTHTCVNRSELFIEQFQQEVTDHVPKSIETATK
jgi:hypothetical protein